MINKGKANSPVEPSDFIRQFAVTKEGRSEIPGCGANGIVQCGAI
jgi:hypothetical protein